MKKNYYLLFIALCFMFAITKVDAIPGMNYPKGLDETGKFPFQVETDESDILDLSGLSFASDAEGVSITGPEDFKKIYSSYSCDAEDEGCDEGTSYFTAYCFDGNKKYPEYNSIYLANTGAEATEENSIFLFRMSAVYQVLKACQALETCTLFDDINNGVTAISFEGSSGTNPGDPVEYYIDEPDAATIASFNSNESVTAAITSFTIVPRGSSTPLIFTAEQLSNALDDSSNFIGGKYRVTFKRDDFQYNNYSVDNMPNNIEYNRALWVVEHSYPILELKNALNKAGVNYDTLKAEVAALLGIENTESNSDTITAAIGDYTYAVTQYAIWRVIGEYNANVSGTYVKLGDSLTGSSELNRLYQYLIMDRNISATYATDELNYEFVVDKPTNDLYKTLSSSYMYGPYKVTGGGLYTADINVSLAGSQTGVSLADAAGNAHATYTINDGESFYLLIDKTAKVTNVLINFNGTAYKFEGTDTRGKLFLSESALDQVLGTGPSTISSSVDGSTEILINPKTGVDDFGTILLVGLIAFTLGYLVLRFKQDPVKQL